MSTAPSFKLPGRLRTGQTTRKRCSNPARRGHRLADRGIESAILAHKDLREGLGRPPTCDDQRYRDRNAVERCVGHLKERRRLVVRYEKKASHCKAMVLWAFAEEYLNR